MSSGLPRSGPGVGCEAGAVAGDRGPDFLLYGPSQIMEELSDAQCGENRDDIKTKSGVLRIFLETCKEYKCPLFSLTGPSFSLHSGYRYFTSPTSPLPQIHSSSVSFQKRVGPPNTATRDNKTGHKPSDLGWRRHRSRRRRVPPISQ